MIGFAGLSHLGLVSSLAAASKGFDVIAYDPDSSLGEAVRAGRLPVIEPGLAELWAAHRGRMRITHDPAALSACELIVVSADVPTAENDTSDPSVVERLTEAAAAAAPAGTILVILSQVPPGFTRRQALRLRQQRPQDGARLFYQVETLIFGRAVERALRPERYIVGCADPSEPLPASYARWLGAGGCPVLPMRYESAELAKISINMYLASSIGVTNTLAELAEAVGADWSEIAPALRLDKRIGADAYVSPGLGLAGGNIERDLRTVSTLAQELGTDAGVVDAWLANSRHCRDWALRALHADVLSRTPDPLIAVWGLAYKPNTHSTKHSPALALLEALRPFRVKAFDPQVRLNGQASARHQQAASALEACQGADGLVIMTPWAEFAAVKPSDIRQAMAGQTLLDPFGVFDRAQCAQAGLIHHRLGAPRQHAPAPC